MYRLDPLFSAKIYLQKGGDIVLIAQDRKIEGDMLQIMKSIHESCVKYGKNADGSINYVKGANVAGFVKVADAMLSQGVC